jgi:hypothetical protein
VAGGIDWFRWHHGSVTDPKFQLVAKKAGVRLGDVIAVWAFVLEKASADVDRGTIGQIDFETLDFLLGVEEGTATRILDAMTGRGLLVGSKVARWDERQAKREREDDTAAERKRRQREREALERQTEAGNTTENQVTPSHATSHQEKPREEKSREEEKKHPSSGQPDGVLFERFWSAYPRRVGKDAARRAFAKRDVDEPLLALMVAAIKAQGLKTKCAKGEMQYVPHPATWLNEGRWMDEVAANDDDPLKGAL